MDDAQPESKQGNKTGPESQETLFPSILLANSLPSSHPYLLLSLSFRFLTAKRLS